MVTGRANGESAEALSIGLSLRGRLLRLLPLCLAFLAEFAQPAARQTLQAVPLPADEAVRRRMGGKVCGRVEYRVGILPKLRDVAIGLPAQMRQSNAS